LDGRARVAALAQVADQPHDVVDVDFVDSVIAKPWQHMPIELPRIGRERARADKPGDALKPRGCVLGK
jgi:hypothetical protein